ncbi:alkaline phosphatase PhoX [Altererythrobacter fulvus]|uniref:alkaline phosphatase PhoX n=1 Tax=Caenibius fulvus TaxID=2126012 RepID=UPI0030163EF4
MDRTAGDKLTFATLPEAARRAFLRATGSAFVALVAANCMVRPGMAAVLKLAEGYGPLVPDPAGMLDLPAGFSYRVLSRLGDGMSDGGNVPDHGDGMGCFALPNGKIALVRNHELMPDGDSGGEIARGYDRQDGTGPVLPGGTTTIVLDAATLEVESQFRSLGGTIRNCAGGTTPWGSWLTCEEFVSKAGGRLGQDHGYVFEVAANATGPVDPVPLKAMGRFNHEAACVDPATGMVYLTEDRGDGLLYRFIPKVPGQLAEGGRLQALALEGGLTDSRNHDSAAMQVGDWHEVHWVDIDVPDSPQDDLRLQGAAKGAVLFARGEGIHMGEGELYFCCTSGGALQRGQIFRLKPQAGGDQLQLFFETASLDQFNYGDNLTVAPNGHLVVCEDQYSEVVDNHLRGITPAGEAYTLGRLRMQTELAGACFSPDGKTLFVNAFSPTTTFAITGPWMA